MGASYKTFHDLKQFLIKSRYKCDSISQTLPLYLITLIALIQVTIVPISLRELASEQIPLLRFLTPTSCLGISLLDKEEDMW